jgi:hypothetical protein
VRLLTSSVAVPRMQAPALNAVRSQWQGLHGIASTILKLGGQSSLCQHGYATASVTETAALELEHATGLERQELEAKLRGVEDPWHEAW